MIPFSLASSQARSTALRLSLCVALAWSVAACDGHGATSLTPADAPSPAALAAVNTPLRDPGIDASDTYLVMETEETEATTLYTTDPLFDPRTGQQTTSLSVGGETESFRIEAGYGTDGVLRVSQYAEDAPLDPYTTPEGDGQSARIVGAAVTVYDAAGQAIAPEPVAGMPTDLDLGDVIPPDADIVGGVVIEPELAPAAGSTRFSAAVDARGEALPMRWLGKDRFEVVSSLPPSERGHEQTTQRFKRGKGPDGRDVFVLDETITERETNENGQRVKTRSHQRVKAIRWQRDRGRDNGRRLRRINAPTRPILASPPMPVFAPPTGPRLVDSCPIMDPECGNGGGGTVPSDPCGPVAGGTNLVWQHGINSDASTWGGTVSATDGTRGRVRCTYRVGSEVAISMRTKGLQSHAEQTERLKEGVVATGRSQFVFIGHSQGGLISRHAAQEFALEGRPDLTRAIITVGTPHQGALLAHNLRPSLPTVLSAVAFDNLSCGSGTLTRIVFGACWVKGALLGTVVTGFVGGIVATFGGAPTDLVPGSAAMQRLNRSESFLRYGIQHTPKKRWSMVRLAGDNWGGVTPDGHKWVKTMEYVWWTLRVGAWACLVIPGLQAGAVPLRSLGGLLDSMDAIWNTLVSLPWQTSDGIVHGPSQIYPNATENFERRADATSHLGETRSNGTREALQTILRVRLGIPLRSGGGA